MLGKYILLLYLFKIQKLMCENDLTKSTNILNIAAERVSNTSYTAFNKTQTLLTLQHNLSNSIFENDFKRPFYSIFDKINTETTEEKTGLSISSNKNSYTTCKDANRKKLENQPVITEHSHVKKCCPKGESLHIDKDNRVKYCDKEKYRFKVEIINAVFYDNCIEDIEETVHLQVVTGNPCNISFTYADNFGDQLFILQDGSLLILDEFGNQSMTLTQNYCLDVNYSNGDLQAMVCVSSMNKHIIHEYPILFCILMFISISCLLFLLYINLAISKLRTVHGLCFSFLAISFAIKFTIQIYLRFITTTQGPESGFAAIYFILTYFLWMTILSLNIVLSVWYFLPRCIVITQSEVYYRTTLYALIAFSIPLMIVITISEMQLNLQPGSTHQTTKKYYTGTVIFCILSSTVLLLIAYFGFRQLNKRLIVRNNYNEIMHFPIRLNQELLFATKKDGICILFLVILISINWIFAAVICSSPDCGYYFTLVQIIYDLQGLFILLIYVFPRDKRDTISNWWHNQGAYKLSPETVNYY